MQDSVRASLHVQNTKHVHQNLIRDVHRLTQPLFEIFGLFSLSESAVRDLVKGLFDPDREALN